MGKGTGGWRQSCLSRRLVFRLQVSLWSLLIRHCQDQGITVRQKILCLKRSHEMRYPLLNIVIVRHDLARGQGNANAVSRWWHLVRTICHRPKDPRPWPSTKSRLTPWLDWCCVCALCPVHCALCPAWLEPVPSPLPGKGECDCECDCERQRERAFLMAVFCKHRKASKQAFAAVLGLLGSIPS